MRFGDLPLWALELSDQIHKIVCFGYKETNTGVLNVDKEACVLPSQLLFRDPCFDQLILNVYQPGEVRFKILAFNFVNHASLTCMNYSLHPNLWCMYSVLGVPKCSCFSCFYF